MANSFVTAEGLTRGERFYPLRAMVCTECLLVQLSEFESPDEIFSDYPYFSSFSDSWVEHARRYADSVYERFGLGPESQVIELASNDGYLLQHFVEMGVPVLGVEPAANVAAVAVERGIKTRIGFFGTELADELLAAGLHADLLIGNNVLAHVPKLNDFVAGMTHLLAPTGVVTMEFPHLYELMTHHQFDTIYHEHFSYFTLLTVRDVFARHGLRIFDVERVRSHGGSLRIFACHAEAAYEQSERIAAVDDVERAAGLHVLEGYRSFDDQVHATKYALLRFLIDARERGEHVVAYGAPAKGNTLLNYCGIRTDLIDFTVDRSPLKQGRYLPGTRIPILAPEALGTTRPDYVLILPWNLKEEIISQMAHVREWGGRFVVPIPELEVLE